MQQNVREQSGHSCDTTVLQQSLQWTRAASAHCRCSAHCSRAAISISSGQQQPVDVLRRRYDRPDLAAWLSPPVLVKRFAGTASSSALESHPVCSSLWIEGSLVMLLNMLATPSARSHRLAEIRKDSPQLPARCKKVWIHSRPPHSHAFWARD